MKFLILQAFLRLWQEAPAFLIAFPLYFGALFALQKLYGLAFFLLFLLTIPKRRLFLSTMLFLLPLSFIHPTKKTESGEGSFRVDSISPARSHFGFSYHHRGRWSFKKKNKGWGIPCSYYSKRKEPSFTGRATLTPLQYGYRLKVHEHLPQKPSRLLSWRDRFKSGIRNTLRKQIQNRKSRSFLIGIVTGELEDELLANAFASAGLSHLLAISGLHFALLTLFCLSLLRWMPRKTSRLMTLLITTAYALLICPTPSICRAWIFSFILILGELLEREINGLNTLGIALAAVTFFDPFALVTLSFQLTFLATAGILLFYKKMTLAKEEIEEATAVVKVAMIFSLITKRAFRLTASATIATLPLLIYRFHSFHPHILLTNLFLPTLFSLSLLLLFSSILFPPLHTLNSQFTSLLLSSVESPLFRLPGFYFIEVSPLFPLIVIPLLFFWGLYQRYREPLPLHEEGQKNLLNRIHRPR